MGNCLVTKLKSTVSGFLPTLNDLIVEITDYSIFKLKAKTTAYDVVARAKNAILYALDENGDKTGNPVDTITIGENGIGVADNTNNNIIYLSNNDKLREIHLQGCFASLKYSNDLDDITMIAGIYTDAFPSNPNTHIDAQGYTIPKHLIVHGLVEGQYTDLTNLPENKTYPCHLNAGWGVTFAVYLNVTEAWCKAHNAIYSDLNFGNQILEGGEGSFDALGFLNGDTNLWMTGGTANPAQDRGMLRGSMEQFVRNKRSIGFTTGSITLQYVNFTHITFNGNPIESVTGNPPALSWTENTITFDGVTINA